MNYRNPNKKNEMSILGFGCMRLPKKGGHYDTVLVEKLIHHAVEAGINYFDTAYIYSGNEEIVGRTFERLGLRDQVMIATKIPHYMIKDHKDFDRYFDEQLKRLKTDHIDNYLMHMLPDVSVWDQLKSYGVEQWVREKKESGQIRNFGFSYHGNSEIFCELLDAFQWDFCQVQYNYMDETSQAGRKGVEKAAALQIPVIIMEPLRGGRLAVNLPSEAEKLIEQKEPRRSAAEWGLRWLWDQSSVTTVLSGMCSMDMLEENIRIAETCVEGELSDEDHCFYRQLKEAISGKVKIGCTGCGYCQPCPHGVDIPGVFRCYNASYIDNYFTGFREYVMCTTMKRKRTNASLCVSCGLCETHCPQHIGIRGDLQKVRHRFENPVYKLVSLYFRHKIG